MNALFLSPSKHEQGPTTQAVFSWKLTTQHYYFSLRKALDKGPNALFSKESDGYLLVELVLDKHSAFKDKARYDQTSVVSE